MSRNLNETGVVLGSVGVRKILALLRAERYVLDILIRHFEAEGSGLFLLPHRGEGREQRTRNVISKPISIR